MMSGHIGDAVVVPAFFECILSPTTLREMMVSRSSMPINQVVGFVHASVGRRMLANFTLQRLFSKQHQPSSILCERARWKSRGCEKLFAKKKVFTRSP